MKQILVITLLIIFIPFELEAKDYVCQLWDEGIFDLKVELFSENTNKFKCKAGDTLQVVNTDSKSLAMNEMILLCADNSIQVFRYDDEVLHAACKLASPSKRKKSSILRENE